MVGVAALSSDAKPVRLREAWLTYHGL